MIDVQVPLAIDECDDHWGKYTGRWMVTPPAADQAFYVVRDEWTDDLMVRTIWEWTADDPGAVQ